MHIEIDRFILQWVKICITGHKQEVLPPVADDWAFQVANVIYQARCFSQVYRISINDQTWLGCQNYCGLILRDDLNEVLDIGEVHGASFWDWAR